MSPKVSIIDKATLKEQMQENVLQVFEDVNLIPSFIDEKQVGTVAYLEVVRNSNEYRDQILDNMCDVIIETINKA